MYLSGEFGQGTNAVKTKTVKLQGDEPNGGREESKELKSPCLRRDSLIPESFHYALWNYNLQFSFLFLSDLIDLSATQMNVLAQGKYAMGSENDQGCKGSAVLKS